MLRLECRNDSRGYRESAGFCQKLWYIIMLTWVEYEIIIDIYCQQKFDTDWLTEKLIHWVGSKFEYVNFDNFAIDILANIVRF